MVRCRSLTLQRAAGRSMTIHRPG